MTFEVTRFSAAKRRQGVAVGVSPPVLGERTGELTPPRSLEYRVALRGV